VPDGVTVDFPKVMERMRKIRSGISKHDSAKRFAEAGVDVYIGEASHSRANGKVNVSNNELIVSKAVIATGARAMEPPIPGLAEAGFLTNETIFNLTERPDRLVVVGAGPIGCELAQTFQRLGCQVTLIEMAPQILVREDPDAARIVSAAMERDGVEFLFNASIQRVEKTGTREKRRCRSRRPRTDHRLRRNPNRRGPRAQREPLKPGVGRRRLRRKQGVKVDDNLRTSNPSIYAAGDICNQFKFTHTADAAARIVIQNTLFGLLPKKKNSALTVPWCTYTDPEIAHVGLNEKMAEDRGIAIDTFTIDMASVDRAIAEGDTDGMLKIHVEKGKDTIAGATLVSRHAGDMISEITLAMVGGIGLGTIANVIHPYPTQAEIIKKAADAYNKTRFTPTVAKLFDKVIAWQR
jgi:pyruvate/2-oxoglutarate dehydrogenase complex dihydrolipoamide dehydrogenase (E3) component